MVIFALGIHRDFGDVGKRILGLVRLDPNRLEIGSTGW